MTIQTRKLYGLQYGETTTWYMKGQTFARTVRTFKTRQEAIAYRAANHLTTTWQVKPVIEKLERVE